MLLDKGLVAVFQEVCEVSLVQCGAVFGQFQKVQGRSQCHVLVLETREFRGAWWTV